MLKEAIIFVICCIIMVKAASYAVRSSTHLARAMRLTEFITSFIIVAAVSAMPDTIIALTATLTGHADLGVGALLGGNIADLTIVLGLVALVGHPIKITSMIIKKDIYFIGLATLPILLGMNGKISRIDGVILLIAGITFFAILLREAKYFHKPFQEKDHALRNLIIFLVSIAVMIISAHFVVQSASSIATTIGIPALILGAILIGLGTTLPELTFSIQSIRNGHADLAVGDLLGNVIIDSCIILGIIALINPITVNIMIWSIIGTFVVISAIFAIVFMKSDGILTRNEAMTLILFYVAFVVVNTMLA